jgi:hypothetical protein
MALQRPVSSSRSQLQPCLRESGKNQVVRICCLNQAGNLRPVFESRRRAQGCQQNLTLTEADPEAFVFRSPSVRPFGPLSTP